MKLKLVRVAFIAAMPLATAIAPVASSAAAPSATVVISPTAELTATGSALLTIDYQCQPGLFGGFAFLETALEQPGTFGFGTAVSMTCDDQKHRATLDNVPGPFTPGSANAFAFVSNGFLSFKEAEAEVTVK